MESSGKKLKSAAAPAPASNFCQMLQEIADAKRFEVALYDLQDRTTTGTGDHVSCLDAGLYWFMLSASNIKQR